jgi:hypothetical protein
VSYLYCTIHSAFWFCLGGGGKFLHRVQTSRKAAVSLGSSALQGWILLCWLLSYRHGKGQELWTLWKLMRSMHRRDEQYRTDPDIGTSDTGSEEGRVRHCGRFKIKLLPIFNKPLNINAHFQIYAVFVFVSSYVRL